MKRTISLFLITVLLLSFTSFGTVFAADPTVTATMSWDDPDTGRIQVSGTFPAEYAGKKVVMFVTDPAVDLNNSTIADSEKYFGIRQGFIAADGSYSFNNLFYARPGTYQVNVIADTMTAPVTTSLTVTGTYYDFTVTANEGGTVTPSGTTQILRNDSVNVKITCDDGYQVKSITKNGSALPVLSEFVIETVTENIALDVVFEQIPATDPVITQTYTNAFTSSEPVVIGGQTITEPMGIVFAKVKDTTGYTLLDYGMELASDRTVLESGNGKEYSALGKKSLLGNYGICFYGSFETDKTYYSRPYAIYVDGEGKQVKVVGNTIEFTPNPAK